MRALVVTNMWPSSPSAPQLGSFVRDQVEALRQLDDVEIEVFHFPLGGARAYVRAWREARTRYRRGEFDVVHAHFGLNAWPALGVRGAPHAVTLHGTDLRHPRSRRITLAALGRMDLVATVSEDLARELPEAVAARAKVLPCGVDIDRFVPIPRAEARARLGLEPESRYVLLPADPARPGKRADRAREVAGDDAQLVTLGRVHPLEVPLWVNAANAVLVPSDREGFGLAVLEALACDVPVLATPTGIHPEALAGVDGTLCAPYDRDAWRAALAPHLAADDPRVAGRPSAERWSARTMAEHVLVAWRELTGLYSAAEAPSTGALSA
jgi:glycosyltransferase involved in cell wall biosynthesis